MRMFLLLTCLLIGCSNVKPDNIIIRSDEKLRPLVSEFFSYCTNILSEDSCFPKIELQLKIAELSDNTLGQCTVYAKPDYLRVVEIQPEVVTGYNLRAVLYHELMHCVLDKPHYDDEIDIMNSYEYEQNTQVIYLDWVKYVKTALLRKD